MEALALGGLAFAIAGLAPFGARAQAPGPVVSSQVRNSFAGLRKRKANDPYQAGRPVKAMGQGEEPGASGDGSGDRNAAFAPLDIRQCVGSHLTLFLTSCFFVFRRLRYE